MFNLVTKHLTFSLFKTPSVHNVVFFRSLSSSSNPKLVKYDYSTIDNSFTVSYLIDSCGFPPEKAISASKYLTIKTPDKPDSVRQFFKNQGFTEPQISQLLFKFPVILASHPQKSLLPKFQFFRSLGLSSCDLVKLFTTRPKCLSRSLKNHLQPSITLLQSLLQSHDKTLIAIRRCAFVLDCDFRSNVIPNMQALRDIGVPPTKMMYLFTYQPRVFMVGTQQFKSIVDQVVKMGFDPTKTRFMLAVHAIRSMSKPTWDKKMETYNKWGWSKSEILVAFRSDPWCMMKSEEKIDKVMDYFVNKMGFEMSIIAKNPLLFSLSMEKRIIPRCSVYEYCLKKGLLKNKNSFSCWIKYSDSIFVKRLQRIEKVDPGVLKLYQ